MRDCTAVCTAQGVAVRSGKRDGDGREGYYSSSAPDKDDGCVGLWAYPTRTEGARE